MAKPPYRRQRNPSSWRRLATATWRAPNDPTVYGTLDVDMTAGLDLIDCLRREEGIHVTVTHLVAKSLAMSIALHPEGNGLVLGRRVYLRDDVDIFCQVASEDGRDLSGVKLKSADQLSVAEIATQLATRAARVRARQDLEVERTKASLDRIPSWLLGPAMRAVSYLSYDLGLDLRRFGVAYDQFGSAMVTSIGSVDAGLGMALAPLVPFSRVPIVVLVNAVQRRPIAIGDAVEVGPLLSLGCTFDHRFIDGMIASSIARELHRNLLHADERLAEARELRGAAVG
jgi:pyruvate/2-oxoglutarate dehydrogenase complex dihydrolipoamide acyltransferase (E2) component